MTRARTYLDHNASAPLRPEARDAMFASAGLAGNPSSVHAEGRAARRVVETAREQVAGLVGARPAEVVFTSGATEANVWVVSAGWDAIVVGATEHDSVRAPAAVASQADRPKVDVLPVDCGGLIDREWLADWCRANSQRPGRRLLALQWANNETGVVQPIVEVAQSLAGSGLSWHCDAVQAAGRLPIDFAATAGITTMALSAHKLGGPTGVGALVIRDGTRLASMIAGGGQERRRRAGTENVAGIAGFGAAAEAARGDLAEMPRVARLRDRLVELVSRITPGAVIVASQSPRLANTVSVALPGEAAETLVIKLDLAGIAVSSGAACSSGKVGPSHVLAAMSVPHAVASSTIRLSLGWNSSEADLETFSTAWATIAARNDATRAVA